MATTMTAAQKSVSFFNVMQLFSTGRLDSETEQRIVLAVGADDLSGAFRELKKQDAETLIGVQKIIGPRHGNGSRVENPGQWLLTNGVWAEAKR